MKIVLATGGFDPIHSGHISYLRSAKSHGDKLVVGLNSDDWLRRKKGREFMSWDERASIVSSLAMVDDVIAFKNINDGIKEVTDQTIKLGDDRAKNLMVSIVMLVIFQKKKYTADQAQLSLYTAWAAKIR